MASFGDQYLARYLTLISICLMCSSCQFISIKQYQCLNPGWIDARQYISKKLRFSQFTDKEVILGTYSSTNTMNLDLKVEADKIYVYKGSCPIWKYVFLENNLVESGGLFFEGFWFYDKASFRKE